MYVAHLKVAAFGIGIVTGCAGKVTEGRKLLADFGQAVVSFEQLVQNSSVDAEFEVVGSPIAVEIAEPNYLL